MLRCILVAFVCSVASSAFAEVGPLSQGELIMGSSHQLKGEVRRVYSAREVEDKFDGQYQSTLYLIELAVTEVEKGDDIEKGNVAFIRCYRRMWVGQGMRPGDKGQMTIPTEGSTVVVYVKESDQDKGLDMLLPNGCRILKGSSQLGF